MYVGDRFCRIAFSDISQAKAVWFYRAKGAQTVVQSFVLGVVCRPYFRKLGNTRTVGPFVPLAVQRTAGLTENIGGVRIEGVKIAGVGCINRVFAMLQNNLNYIALPEFLRKLEFQTLSGIQFQALFPVERVSESDTVNLGEVAYYATMRRIAIVCAEIKYFEAMQRSDSTCRVTFATVKNPDAVRRKVTDILRKVV